jgi:hypothetical protein
MTKKLYRDVRHLMICHSFAFRSSDFVIFRFETETGKDTGFIRRYRQGGVALPISKAFHPRFPGPEV